MTTREMGNRGEDLAAQFLIEKGYQIVARQVHIAHAEIDLICHPPNSEDLVFVEVKARRGSAFGRPEEAITPAKQRHLLRAAEGYLYRENIEGVYCRFDVVAVQFERGRVHIEHFEDAFHG